MRRTQLMLDEWQYEALRSRAESEGRSMSGLVRDILGAHLEQPKRGRLALIEGVAEGPSDLAREHDRYLYGDLGAGGTGGATGEE